MLASALLLACTSEPDSGATSAVQVTFDEEMPTIPTLSWSTEEPEAFVVTVTEAGHAPRERVEAEATTHHEQRFIGLAADTEYSFAVGDDPARAGTFTTGPLPPQVPTLTVEATESFGEGWYATVIGGAKWGSILLDYEGRITWWWLTQEHNTTRARVSRDQSAMLYNYACSVLHFDNGPDAAIIRVPFDGGPEERTPVPYNSHDFVELPNGNFAVIVYDSREVNGETVLGDAVVEVTPVSGESRVIWSAFDHFDPVDVAITGALGWTHANALDYDEADDSFILSLHNFGSLVKFGRDGTQEWVFGRLKSDFTFSDPDTAPSVQHQFDFHGGHLWLFDNGAGPLNPARVSDYVVDEAERTAELVGTYQTDPPQIVPLLGDVTALDDRSLLIDWSNLGMLQRQTVDGEVVFQASAELGYAFGFLTPVTLE